MKKKVNYYKIGVLVMMLVQIGLLIWVDKDLVKADINVWRLCILSIMFIPIDVMYICTKQTRRVKNGKTSQAKVHNC